jgi:hypothetical protein
MKLRTRFAFMLLFVPLVASAQYRDLDAALGNLERGFGGGEVQAIITGIGDGEQVMLQFPGLVEQNGFFGRDQAAYLLDKLFNQAKPSQFEQVGVKRNSAEGQYLITARWTVAPGGSAEVRDLTIILRSRNDRWSVVSVRSGGK